ncbi:integrase, partial [Streptomyces sp. NRRL F-6602]
SRPPKIPSNPFRDEDLSPPSRPPSKAKAWDEERLYAVRQALDARYRMLPDLGAGAGLRQGEAFGFSPDDIVGDEIHVARQVVRINSRLAFAPPKGNK